MTDKKILHKGVENRAIGIWDDLYRGLPGPVKSFFWAGEIILIGDHCQHHADAWRVVFHNPASARR